MNRSTAEFLHFHARTGSHSTKGYGSGRVDVLPTSAKEVESFLRGLEEAVRLLTEAVKDSRRTPADRRAAQKQLKTLRKKYSVVSAEEVLFKAVARCELTDEVFSRLAYEAKCVAEMYRSRWADVVRAMSAGSNLSVTSISALPAPTSAPSDWLAALSPEHLAKVHVKGWNSPADIIRDYTELERFLSRRALKSTSAKVANG